MSGSLAKARIIILILLLPLLFINVKNSHDWGDDFAQYLIQARNIVNGNPQTDNGLLSEEGDAIYAVEAYPVGFPVILAPVYAFFGTGILPYTILISLFLVAAGMMCFEFFRRYTTAALAVLITLLFCYNHWIIDFKKHILSEIPFTFFLFLTLHWHQSKGNTKKYSWLVTGLLFSWLISIRLAGIAFLAAYIIHEMLSRDKERMKSLLSSVMAAAAFFVLLNEILFSINATGLFGFYGDSYAASSVSAIENLQFYLGVIEHTFPFFGIGIPAIWIAFAVAGWLICIVRSPGIFDFGVPIYVMMILLYPYADAGHRFLIPVLPFLIYYTVYFVGVIFSKLKINSEKPVLIIAALLLAGYIMPLTRIVSTQPEIENGPQEKEAVEMIDYLQSADSSAIMVFRKARAMSLYSGKNVIYPAKNISNSTIHELFQRYDSLYLILSKPPENAFMTDHVLSAYLSEYGSHYEKAMENEGYLVFRKK